MTEDITMNPERTDRGMQTMEREQFLDKEDHGQAQSGQTLQAQAQSVRCPH